MTEVEFARMKEICRAANVDDIEEVSDGFHTFNDLYEQRMYLFAALVNAYKDNAWKSLRHEDGEECFGGDWFVVGIDTPDGSYTYHYSIKYWDVFDCQVLKRGKHWDGHTDKDVTRLLSLPSAQPKPCEDCVSRKAVIRLLHSGYHSKSMIEEVKELPSAQPEPEIYWGYTPTYGRPLADDEIVSRLRDINAQLGGSYAINRAIEIIEAVAERRTDGRLD